MPTSRKSPIRKDSKSKPASARPAHESAPQTDSDLIAFLKKLKHPLRAEIDLARRAVLGISPRVREGIKWNSVSFRTADYFATIHLRSTDSLQLILHRGAKVKDNSTYVKIPDPRGLIRWLATDRCLVSLGSGPTFKSNLPAFKSILRAWIKQL